MSLNVDVDAVKAVLLADGWHEVADNSFDIGAYEFFHNGRRIFAGGRKSGVSASGARWGEADGYTVVCPITAILAVKVG